MAVDSGAAIVKKNAKWNKSPRIRLVGSRIYDSINGKSCHQCRQKTRDFSAACKNLKITKPCTIMYCHKCLLNRYGEKAEEVDVLGEWSCPKCRGICNCSVCMKKRGHQPTGILINTAKATGFSSVSEMLQHFQASLPNKRGKENVTANKSKKVVNQRKLEKEAIAEMHNCNKKHGGEGTDSRGTERKRCRSYELENKKDADEMSVNEVEKKLKQSRKELEKDDSKKRDVKLKVGRNPDENVSYRVSMTRKDAVKRLEDDNTTQDEIESASTLVVLKQHNTNSFLDIPMPLKIELKSVAGLDVSVEDVGNALQFLEFCAAVGKGLECLKRASDHESLKPTEKLSPLNFLCDEILETEKSDLQCYTNRTFACGTWW